jgi:hypothetical protein
MKWLIWIPVVALGLLWWSRRSKNTSEAPHALILATARPRCARLEAAPRVTRPAPASRPPKDPADPTRALGTPGYIFRSYAISMACIPSRPVLEYISKV